MTDDHVTEPTERRGFARDDFDRPQSTVEISTADAAVVGRIAGVAVQPMRPFAPLAPFPFALDAVHWFDAAEHHAVLTITGKGKCKVTTDRGTSGFTFTADDALAELPLGTTIEKNADVQALFLVLPADPSRDVKPVGIGGLPSEGVHAVMRRGWNWIVPAPKPQ